MLTTKQRAALDYASSAAWVSEKLTGVPSEITIAQWALESGWGENSPGNNPFGIKAYPGCFGKQLLTTREVIGGKVETLQLWFATFADLAAAFTKHALLLSSGPYAQAFKAFTEGGSLTDFANAIGRIYATAPDYGEQIIALMQQQNIRTAISLARDGQRPTPELA